jgi:undecaprenyl-diphosphatase
MNLNIWQTIFLALLQGITELFPISSLGNTVIFPGLLGWSDVVRDKSFLPLIVALHLGTAVALLLYFWRDWLQVIRSILKSIKDGEVRTGTEEWVSFLIIIGCIPAGLLGVFLEKPLKQVFASPLIAAAYLILNGSLLFLGERMRVHALAKETALSTTEREVHFRPLKSLSWKEAIIVGLAQSLALIPGISRSGASMVAGLGIRLNHEDAARFSFLLGTPIIGAAAILELPQLIGQSNSVLLLIFVGMVISGVAAFLSTRFLMKYFETRGLYPFAFYCWGLGLVALILFLTVFSSRA